jgi:hypothetical protein
MLLLPVLLQSLLPAQLTEVLKSALGQRAGNGSSRAAAAADDDDDAVAAADGDDNGDDD